MGTYLRALSICQILMSCFLIVAFRLLTSIGFGLRWAPPSDVALFDPAMGINFIAQNLKNLDK